MSSALNTFLRSLCRLQLGMGAYDWADLNGEPDLDGTIRLLIIAPDDTPFAGGMFSVNLKVPDIYPQKPPEVSFNTRIWHPLVDWTSGRICQDYFREGWQASDGPVGLLSRIRSFFYVNKVYSSVNFEAAEQLVRGDGSYAEKAMIETQRYASN